MLSATRHGGLSRVAGQGAHDQILPLEKFQTIHVPFHDSIAKLIEVAVQLPAGYLVPVIAAPVSEDHQSPLFISS
jgi:hypothetical protein